MGISQPQNLRTPPIEKLRPYGVRVSLPMGDPFRKLLGPEWHRLHWYSTPAERDAALAEMGRRHQYSRAGDKPSLVFEKVENLAQSRGLWRSRTGRPRKNHAFCRGRLARGA